MEPLFTAIEPHVEPGQLHELRKIIDEIQQRIDRIRPAFQEPRSPNQHPEPGERPRPNEFPTGFDMGNAASKPVY